MASKKIDKTFVIKFRDIDPYTGHIDSEEEICRTDQKYKADRILECLVEYNTKSKQGKPNREYTITEIQTKMTEYKKERRHWWTW